MKHTNQRSGFTLLELAIVMVIMGLLLASILVGRNMINTANIRSSIAQIEKFDAAVNTFHAKYNGLPGDLVSPTQYFPTIVATAADGHGDSDGSIEGSSDASTVCTVAACLGGETAIAFTELELAGLIGESITTLDVDSYTLTPSPSTMASSKLNHSAQVLLQGFNGRNYYIIGNFGAVPLVAGSGTFTSAITPIDANNVDDKIDDASPTQGKMISTAVDLSNPVAVGNGALAAAMTAAECYNVTSDAYATKPINGYDNTDLLNCSVSIRASF